MSSKREKKLEELEQRKNLEVARRKHGSSNS